MDTFSVVIKTILFDGANTKLSTFTEDSADEILIALPQNANYGHLCEGDVVKIGVLHDNIKCYEEE